MRERPSSVDLIRAFGGLLGGSLALAGAASTSVATTIHSVAARRRPPSWALGGIVACAIYRAPVLGWIMRGRERQNVAAIKGRLERGAATEKGDGWQ